MHYMHAVFEAALKRRSCSPNSFAALAAVSDFAVIKALTANGLGVSFVYRAVAARELAEGTLATFSLEGVDLWGSFYFVCLKDNVFVDAWME